MSSAVEVDEDPRAPDGHARSRWWVGVALFVGGVVVGVLGVGLLNATTPEFLVDGPAGLRRRPASRVGRAPSRSPPRRA